jgi:hypothetical protein
MTITTPVMFPAITLPTVGLSQDERDIISQMLQTMTRYEYGNALKAAYYEGEQRVQQLGIAIPPNLQELEAVVGWPGTTVDVLEERLDWYGWATDGDDFDLGDVYGANVLDVEAGMAHLDALIYGTAFAVVGSGGDGEPSPLVTMHSPRAMTGLWDARRRRLRAAFSTVTEGGQSEAALYLPDQTVYLSRTDANVTSWVVDDRDVHRLGRVPVAQFVNRPRASRPEGRSEISRSVRYYTDNAVRTMLGMEVHREFYQAPQRYALGVDENAFTDTAGNVRTGWETIMGRVWAIGRDEDGELPEIGQFTPASPAPYIDQVKGIAQLLAAEAAIPPSYLGFQTDNPASADAIQRSEARLVKRAERRQAAFGRTWLEVGQLCLLVRDGVVPDEFSSVTSKWRDASTPTRSAAADEATKLVGAGVLPPDSAITYDRIGLSPAEQRQLSADRRRATGSAALQAIAAAAQNRQTAVNGANGGAGATPPA